MIWLIETRDESHAASEAARTLLDAFVRAGERDFAIALSGGRAAPLLFRELLRQAGHRRCPLEQADFFWADERCVPPDHPESNFGQARGTLLEPLGVAPERIHRLAGERPAPEAVRLATEDWRQWTRGRGGRGELDALVLGVGEDGHVASLFPGGAPEGDAAAPYLAVTSPKPPPARITMTYPVLWAARDLVVLAPGEGKRAIVHASLQGTQDTPLARVLRRRAARNAVVIITRAISAPNCV